jgi:hypothetical protein
MIDPRYCQFAALSTLTFLQITRSDFGTSLEILALTLYSIAFFHLGFSFLLGTQHFDVRSSLISAFSISLLLRSNDLTFYILAAFLAVASKIFVSYRAGAHTEGRFWLGRQHIVNPACFTIVVMLTLFQQQVWVSPGAWGSATWLAALAVCLAAVVLSRSRSAFISISFLVIWSALTLGRNLWLGDPLSISLHQLQSGALLIFTFFMISDPMTAPRDNAMRFIFATFVALTGFVLHYEFRVREALFYALFAMSFCVPLLAIIQNKRGIVPKIAKPW